MDTLILLEDDAEHVDTVKEGGIQNPNGFTSVDKISGKLQWFNDKGTQALNDPNGLLAAAYCTKILRKIVNFTDAAMAAERAKPPNQQADVEEIQIVAEFHQTNEGLAAAITKAFTDLPNDAKWKALQRKHNVALRVRRVWLLSCESGGDNAKNKALAPKYVKQAEDMRNAALEGCKTEKQYPPSNPAEYWVPYVYTFSTGDIVTGSTTLNPNKVEFKRTPYWKATPKGEIVETQQGKDYKAAHGGQEFIEPALGGIFQYGDPSKAPTVMIVSVGSAPVDILNNPMNDH